MGVESNADHNVLIVENSSISYVYGGQGINATNNSISLTNCTVTRDADIIAGSVASLDMGYATNNTVTLSGTGGDLSKASIYGGSAYDEMADAVSGNKLVLDGFKGTATGVYNFETLEITIDNWQDGDTVLSLTASNCDLAGLSGINLTVASLSAVAEGESMTLISGLSAELNLNDIAYNNTAYELSLIANGSTWDLMATSLTAFPAVPEPATASLSLLGMGGFFCAVEESRRCSADYLIWSGQAGFSRARPFS